MPTGNDRKSALLSFSHEKVILKTILYIKSKLKCFENNPLIHVLGKL